MRVSLDMRPNDLYTMAFQFRVRFNMAVAYLTTITKWNAFSLSLKSYCIVPVRFNTFLMVNENTLGLGRFLNSVSSLKNKQNRARSIILRITSIYIDMFPYQEAIANAESDTVKYMIYKF